MQKTKITAITQIQDYEKSLSAVLKKIENNKHQAITTVNKLLIDLYWVTGKLLYGFKKNMGGERALLKKYRKI